MLCALLAQRDCGILLPHVGVLIYVPMPRAGLALGVPAGLAASSWVSDQQLGHRAAP